MDRAGSFLDFFGGIEDPRSTRNRKYLMEEILLTTLCACLCGAEGWQDIEDFGKSKLDFLRRYFPYASGIPSDDTFRRFFRCLNPEDFQERFVSWVRSLLPVAEEKLIAIDGKTLRRSFDEDKKALHMVSAFASELNLVLGQEKVADKSNEITAIPKILEWLDLRGAIVTIDAMGCQHAIANQIKAGGGEYVLALKGNQTTLHDDVRSFFEDDALLKEAKPNLFTSVDKGHGRIETRTCSVISDVEWLGQAHPKWKTIQSIVRIDSIREMKNSTTCETRYFIASFNAPAQKIMHAIRSHWAIENSLHWILDVSLGEDQSRIRKNNAPHIMAILKHVTLNMLQTQKKPRQSIKRLQKMAGWSDQILSEIIHQHFS